jgi:hypothetical protein
MSMELVTISFDCPCCGYRGLAYPCRGLASERSGYDTSDGSSRPSDWARKHSVRYSKTFLPC